jgi:ABC-2 type transport system permease protein/lipopolysaccharide transport system permease protein
MNSADTTLAPGLPATRDAQSQRNDRRAKAVADLVDGLRNWELWGTVGWHDIRQRYRRSMLGPFWITLSMGVMVTALGFLYAEILHQDVRTYLPYLALGFIVWALISGLILDACSVFSGAGNIIRQLHMPLSVLVYRMVWRHVIIFGHNIVIYALVVLFLEAWPGDTIVLAIPGLLFVCLNGIWVGLLFGLLGARFRDLPPIVASALQVIFFLTPILWTPSLMDNRRIFVDANPFSHFVDIIRLPLLGQSPSLLTWLVVLGMTIGGSAVTFVFFVRFRERIAYWI